MRISELVFIGLMRQFTAGTTIDEVISNDPNDHINNIAMLAVLAEFSFNANEGLGELVTLYSTLVLNTLSAMSLDAIDIRDYKLKLDQCYATANASNAVLLGHQLHMEGLLHGKSI